MGVDVRKVFALLLGVALVGAGIWLGYEEFFVSGYLNLRLLAATAFMLLIGGYVLWAGVLTSPRKRESGGS
jgi:hypothetical protein